MNPLFALRLPSSAFRRLTSTLLLAALLSPSLPAQTEPGTLDETTRLMQDYMAKREEWLTVRRAALERVAKAASETARRQVREQLAEEEKPALGRMAEAARAYRAAKQAKEQQLAASRPQK